MNCETLGGSGNKKKIKSVPKKIVVRERLFYDFGSAKVKIVGLAWFFLPKARFGVHFPTIFQKEKLSLKDASPTISCLEKNYRWQRSWPTVFFGEKHP